MTDDDTPAGPRSDAVSAREEAVRLREEAVRLREEIVAAQQLVAEATALTNLAGEANEKLILATLLAQDMAEAADHSKAEAEASALKLAASERHLLTVAEFRERLIGEVGHDLHGPLVAIQAAAHVLLRERPSSAQAAVLNGVLTSCDRMLEMVSQLLDFTQARLGGGIPVRPQAMELTSVAWSIVAEMEAAYPDRRVHLDAPSCIDGQWDSGRIARVISNLLGNALRHGNPGTPVMVRAHEEGGEAVFEVENEGPPIPPEQLAGLFLPFRRGKVTSHRTKGLGLGLFISEQTVRAHGGTITAESSAEGRTIFRVRLPLEAAAPNRESVS